MNTSQIALVNPPSPPNQLSIKDTMGGLGQVLNFKSDEAVGIESHTVMPVLDLPYTAAVLRKDDVSFEVIDCVSNFMNTDDLLKNVRETKFKMIAIRISTPTYEWDLVIAKLLKENTDAKIILFGPHVDVASNGMLENDCVDAIVFGECEVTLSVAAQNETFENILGVWFKDESGKIIRNPERPRIEDLDSLPFPAWDLLPIERFDSGVMRGINPFVTMLTSRGCPHGCCYCPYPVSQGLKWRHRSAENIADEMEWLQREFGIKAVLFRDPEFGIQINRTIAICNEIIKRGIKIAWRCETRIENLKPEIVKLMADAGCIGINMGVESTSEKVLVSANRKPNYLKDADEVLKLCKEQGIETFCFFIIGLPGDTIFRSLKTIFDAIRWKPTNAQFTVATPYPGTALKKWAIERDYLEDKSVKALTSASSAMRNESMSTKTIAMIRHFASLSWRIRSQGLGAGFKMVYRKVMG